MSLPGRKIRVLVVDDSASVRQTITEVLSGDPEIEVVATASDPYAAARHIQKEVPDVITLDIEMPRMDGITFLRKLMEQRPIPVVICSSLAEENTSAMFQALGGGAVEVITKPVLGTRQFLLESTIRLRDAVKAAAQVNLKRRNPRAEERPLLAAKLSADAMLPPPGHRGSIGRTTDKLICIGASTGGTESLAVVLQALPVDCPGVLVVQHMPEMFTSAFARRLDGLCRVGVKEAEDGDPVLVGHVLIAPGNRHMLLERSGARYRVAVKDGPLVSRHRPSVDVLFRSVAHKAGANAVGVLMTGMGDDGARGLLEMHQAGAITIAQDEESCVVFGMPREAIKLGAAQRIVSLNSIAGEAMRASAMLQQLHA